MPFGYVQNCLEMCVDLLLLRNDILPTYFYFMAYFFGRTNLGLFPVPCQTQPSSARTNSSRKSSRLIPL